MALADRVQERISTQILVGLTRQQDDTTTNTVDTTMLGKACDDVQARFKIWANSVYDETIDMHIAVCVPAVVMMLQAYLAQTLDQYETIMSRMEADMKAQGLVGARNRVSMTSTSTLTPSSENPNNGIVRPDFDRSQLWDLLPGGNQGSDGTPLP